MKRLLLLFMAAVTLASSSWAVTVDDLVSKGQNLTECFSANNTFNSIPRVTSGSPGFKKNSNGNLLVLGALDGKINMELKIYGSKCYLYLDPDGSDIWTLNGNNRIGQYFETDNYYGVIVPVYFTGSGYAYYSLTWDNYNGACTLPGDAQLQRDGSYYVGANQSFQVWLFDSSTDELLSTIIYNGFGFNTFDANATVTEHKKDFLENKESDIEYSANFDLRQDNSMIVHNWGNLGDAYVVDANKNYTFGKFKGEWGIDKNCNGFVKIYGEKTGANIDGNYIYGRLTGSNYNASTKQVQDVEGEIVFDKIAHNNDKTRTKIDMTLKFKDWDAVDPFLSTPRFYQYSKTQVVIKDFDITHYATMSDPSTWLTGNNPGFAMTLNYSGYKHFVKEEQVYMVPGNWNKSNVDYSKGELIGSFDPAEGESVDERIESTDLTFDLSDLNVDENGECTLVVVAKYTDESGLASRILDVATLKYTARGDHGNGWAYHTGGTHRLGATLSFTVGGETSTSQIDATHFAEMDIDKYGYGKGRHWDAAKQTWVQKEGEALMWIKGSVRTSTVRNDADVDHYELCIIPGHHTRANTADFTAEGHANALNISDSRYHTGWNNEPAQAIAPLSATSNGAGDNDGIAFNRFVTNADLREAGIEPSDNGDYTVFLKSVYKAGTDRQPTYHALTTLDGATGATTGVDSITAPDGTDAPARYFTIDGIEVSEPLAPGLYIMVKGNTATKVTVQ